LKSLRGRDRFELDIRAKCESAGAETRVVEKVIAFLKSKGMIDDVRLALDLAAKLSKVIAWGRERIAADLHCRGASEEDIQSAIGTLPPDVDSARRFFAKREGSKKAKIGRQLSAAGYSAETIRELLEE
jgi:SOS response regulatory protein OraA/RecX